MRSDCIVLILIKYLNVHLLSFLWKRWIRIEMYNIFAKAKCIENICSLSIIKYWFKKNSKTFLELTRKLQVVCNLCVFLFRFFSLLFNCTKSLWLSSKVCIEYFGHSLKEKYQTTYLSVGSWFSGLHIYLSISPCCSIFSFLLLNLFILLTICLVTCLKTKPWVCFPKNDLTPFVFICYECIKKAQKIPPFL